MHDLAGKIHTFEDGQKLIVVQIKERDTGEQLVTYHIDRGNAIPQKLVMTMTEFESTFGHLFRTKQ